jgi:hypothetical protein
MYYWTKWRNPIAGFAVPGILIVASIAVFMTAGDLGEAADAEVVIGALSTAAADVGLAWF